MGPCALTCNLLEAAGGPGVVGDRVASKWRAGAGFAGTSASGGGRFHGYTPPLFQKPSGQPFQLQLPAGVAGRLAAQEEDRDGEPAVPEPRLLAADSPAGCGLPRLQV